MLLPRSEFARQLLTAPLKLRLAITLLQAFVDVLVLAIQTRVLSQTLLGLLTATAALGRSAIKVLAICRKAA